MAIKQFLDESLCNELRDAINASPIFTDDERYNPLFNLICAAMDRLDTSVRYLNTHSNYPDTEEDFICFIVFACMVVDGVKKLIENVTKQESQHINEKKYFKKYCMNQPMDCTEEKCPTDDKFFEHFRALAFAHPYETSRNKIFKEKFGKQVSPWVSVNKHMFPFYKFSEPIGVKLYTEKKDENGNDTQYIMFSFSDLKDYLASRYEELVIVIEWAKNATVDAENEWKKVKVNRNQSPLNVLKEIKAISEQRYQEVYTIQNIIDYMECKISDEKNVEAVDKYRKYICSKIEELCDSVDELNNELQTEIELGMIHFSPKNMHQMFHYQMEKIFSYLREKSEYIDPGSNEEWGLIQTEAFYNDFAHKWVYINICNMDYTEIHLLVTTACYLEVQEQRRNGGVSHA